MEISNKESEKLVYCSNQNTTKTTIKKNNKQTNNSNNNNMRHLIMTPTSLSMSTPTLSSLHHQRMLSQSQSTLLSQSQSPSPLTPQSASPSFFSASSPKFPANYERSEKVSATTTTNTNTKQKLNPHVPPFYSSTLYLARFMLGLIAAVRTLFGAVCPLFMNNSSALLCRAHARHECLAFIHYFIVFLRAALIHYFLHD